MNNALGFPFGFFTNDNTPADAKYFKNFNTTGTKVPYVSVAEANGLLVSGLRHIGLTINIAGVEYWYNNGILDTDLVIKTPNLIAQTYNIDRTLPNTGPSYIELGTLQPVGSAYNLTNLIEIYIHGSDVGLNNYTPLYQKYSLPINWWIATNDVWNTLEPDLYTGLSSSWESVHRLQWMQNGNAISLRMYALFGGRGTNVKIKVVDYAPLGFNNFTESTGTGTATQTNYLGSFATRYFLEGGSGEIRNWVDNWFHTGTSLIFGDARNRTYFTKISGGANTGNVYLTLPTTQGTAGQALVTDAVGQLSFTTINGQNANSAIIKEFYINGDNSTLLFTFTHSLNNRKVKINVGKDFGNYEEIDPRRFATTLNTITIEFQTAPLTGENYNVEVIGLDKSVAVIPGGSGFGSGFSNGFGGGSGGGSMIGFNSGYSNGFN